MRLAALLAAAAAAALAAGLLASTESDLVAGSHGWSWLLHLSVSLKNRNEDRKGRGAYGLLGGNALGVGGHGLGGLDLLLDDGRHLCSSVLCTSPFSLSSSRSIERTLNCSVCLEEADTGVACLCVIVRKVGREKAVGRQEVEGQGQASFGRSRFSLSCAAPYRGEVHRFSARRLLICFFRCRCDANFMQAHKCSTIGQLEDQEIPREVAVLVPRR